jgi:hypothetical protein
MQPCWLTSSNGPAADTKNEVVSACHNSVWLSASIAAHDECQIESRAVTRIELVVVDRKAAGNIVVECKESLVRKLLNGQGTLICA